MKVASIPYVQGRNSYSDADGTKYGIAVHNTSNDASAEDEAHYATTRTDGVSSHFYADNSMVIQSLDTAARAGHAGSVEGNNHAVAIEITGVNGWTRQQWLDSVNWTLVGRVLAEVCRCYDIAVRRASVAEMQSNPRVRAFYGHDDMRRAWGGTTHTDPGPGFPWDVLFAAVNAALHDDAEQVAPREDPEEMQIGPNETNIPVPGGNAWRPTWLVFCNDTGHGNPTAPDYTLRIWTTTGNGQWKPIDADGVVTFKSGVVQSFPLPENTRCVSVTRQESTPGVTYDGALSCVLERP